MASESADLDLAGKSTRIAPGDFTTILQAEGRTYDGWDRLSDSVALPQCKFRPNELEKAPPLAGVTLQETEGETIAVIDRLVSAAGKLPDSIRVTNNDTNVPNFPDWTGNLLTRTLVNKGANVQLHFYKRIRNPAEVKVDIKSVTLQSDLKTMKVAVADSIPADVEFAAGLLVQDGYRFNILSNLPQELTVSVPDIAAGATPNAACGVTGDGIEGARASIIKPGLAAITENPFNRLSWSALSAENNDSSVVTVASLPLGTNRYTLKNIGPPVPSSSMALTYTWRLEVQLDGVLATGGFAQPVTVIRPGVPPEPPPTFSIAVIGYDYYDRLVIRITLPESSNYRPQGKYEVYWSPASSGPDAFESLAVPGNLGRQQAQSDLFLFEVLDIRSPVLIDGEYIVGVRSVGGDGAPGRFSVRRLSLHAE